MHRTSSAFEAIPVEDAIAALPVLPMPEPPPAVVPRWCVRTVSGVGSDAVVLVGFDGDGYPLYRFECRTDEDREFWERVIRVRLDQRREQQSGRTVAPLRLL